MRPRYEYKFVRLGEGWFSVRNAAKQEYQQVVHEQAEEGWRLVQVFAPPWVFKARPVFTN